MPKRKYRKPLTIDMEFNEALERFALTDPKEVEQEAAKDAQDQRVRLVRRDADGPPLLIYATDRGMNVELRVEASSFWATQAQMADMFGVEEHTITYHLGQIYGEGELLREATTRKIRGVRREGTRDVSREIEHHDLNALISVGYRVGGKPGTMFRMWATDKLFRYLTKGFVIDEERLKNTDDEGALAEFREIARRIRTSIQNSYREVRNLCKLCADYDGSSDTARGFFMAMENKLLWASANKTAPQLVLERCRADKRDLGLTYYTGKRGPTQRDVVTGNYYLFDGEARTKNRITEMWLTYVEEQLEQGRLPTMQTVTEKLDNFIKFNQWQLLKGRGHHSRADADAHALNQLEIYRTQEEIDDEMEIKKPKKLGKKG